MARKRPDADRTSDRARGLAQQGGDAGMRGVVRAVDAVGLEVQVALVDLLDAERADLSAFMAHQCQRLAGLAHARAERDRNRPRAPVREPHRGDDRLPVAETLETRERLEAAVGEQLEVGCVARVEAQLSHAITSGVAVCRSTKARTLAADASGVSRSVLRSSSGASGSS